MAITVSCLAIFNIGKGIIDSFDTLFVTDSNTDSDTTDISTDTTLDTAIPHTISLGDSGLDVCATNNSSGQAMLGFRTYDLKASTKYRVTWKIDSSITSDMENDLPISFIFNTLFVVRYSTDFAEVSNNGEDLSNYTFSTVEGLCDNTEGCEFTSSELGDEFAIYFFVLPFESTEQVISSKSYVTQYITDFTITEVLE